MVRLVRADVRMLPFRDQSFDVLLDRGTIHYLGNPDRKRYIEETRRVLRPGGRFFLRACLYSAGHRNDIGHSSMFALLQGWQIDRFDRQDLVSDTRTMPALVIRLRKAAGSERSRSEI